MARPSKLEAAEVERRLAELDGWELADDTLRREFRFGDFQRAFAFMASVALAAEKADHHPNWSNVYDRVTIAWTTHDAGGLTELDFRLAAITSKLAQ